MKRSVLLRILVGAAVLAALPVLGAQGANSHANSRAVCPNPPAGYAHCHVLVVTDSHGNPLASSSPTGLDPATIKSVYGFPTGSAGAGTTIAIVDAYDDPNAESDLNYFSSQYGLPECTTANGCFTKVDQNGGTHYPRTNSGWALEISLDIEWAHAIAPGANILLVEAKSSSFTNLLAAEDYAAGKGGAQYVSNSWGGSEFSGESSYDSHFPVNSGVSFFVSAGDSGLPAEYPSASPDVISVGGTTLTDNGNNTWSETGWSGGGGGCSAYEKATSFQSGFESLCGGSARATPDVALDADPSSGVAVYDSVKYQGQQGWFQVGGTSASSPMWAAASADSGQVVDSGYVYGSSIDFNDIQVGNNGASCGIGYDLCSGRGSWIYSSSSLLSGGGGSTSTPTASFTYTCTYLSCDFTDSSTDSGGSIQSWNWDFGDKSGTSTAQNPSYAYSSGGTYTVKLTVTDNNQVSASTTHTFTVTAQPTSGISLAASGYKTKGLEYVQLNWRGSSAVDVYRDGSEVAAAVSGTSYLDPTGNRGGATFQYEVCDAGSTTTCSNTVNVSF